MKTERLTLQIETLVNHLRTVRDDKVTLAEVASVTEVLVRTMQSYFRSLDTSIYKEFRSLSDYIESAKGEIAQLKPKDLQSNKLPRAGLELDAIVKHTEEATNTIMTTAEAIMALEGDDFDTYKTKVNDMCMQLFEACSFQDITGQRIQKVVTTLNHIEERLASLQAAWGDVSEEEEVEAEGEAALLHGPQLTGQGVSQSDVDQMLGGKKGGDAQSAVDNLFP